MRVEKTDLEGVLVIEPRCFADERGFFLESYQVRRYREANIRDNFVQDNHSRSVKGVLRGLHFTVRRPQAQLLTVMRGRIFDVAVDLRPNSKTFGRGIGVELSDEGLRQIYMVPGIAHGFYVLSDMVDVNYKVSEFYDPSDEGGLLWNDPDIAIAWPALSPLVSERDAAYPRLKDIARESLPHMD